LYSVILGSINPIPLTLFNDWQANMKILVDGKEMAPDIGMVSVPYAFFSKSADKFGDNIYNYNGHLGIGKNNPDYNLSIEIPSLAGKKGSVNRFISLVNKVTNIDSLRFSSKRVDENQGWGTACWKIQRIVDVTGMGYIQFGPNYTEGLIFGYHEKEFLRMTNNGYFGIGTKEPHSYLHVVNSGVNNTNVVRIDFNGGNVGSRDESAALLRVVSNSNLRPLLSLNGKSIVTANGSLGIGTTNPVSKLNVYSNDKNNNKEVALTVSSGADQIKIIDVGDDDYGIIGNNGDSTYFQTFHRDGKEGAAIFLNKNGNVGIGTFNPNQKLHVNGDVACNSLHETSDIHYKKNITPIQTPLQKVTQLKGVNYEWKTEEYPEKNFSNGKQIGMIAQDVEKVIPEIVHTDNEGMKSISYDKITAVLVEAIKELKAENEQIKEILCEDRPNHKFCTN